MNYASLDRESLDRVSWNSTTRGNPLFSNFAQVSAAEHSRLDKMKSLIEKFAVKFDSLSTTLKALVTCTNCGKSNPSEDNYFKLKTYFKCKKKAIQLGRSSRGSSNSKEFDLDNLFYF